MSEKTGNRTVLYLLVLICALFWGLSFFATTVALTELNPLQILPLRWTLAAVIFIILALTKVIKVDFRKKNLKLLVLTGFIQPCVYSIFETNGIAMTTTSESSIFIATIPVTVLIMGMLFFGQRYDRKVILGIITAFSGVVICVYFSPAFSLGGKGAGYLVLVGAILSGALYAHVSAKASETFTPMEITVGISIAGCIFFNILSIGKGYGISGYEICFSDWHMFIAIAFLGICCSGICYLIFNTVLSALPTAIASNLVGNTTTAIGVISGCLFAGDPFGWYTVAGLSLTIIGVCTASVFAGKENKTQK